ncbi:hypothetical protein KW785_03670 [Candidatus Parcubacteria bacterium]|nr:hypothetical protein [Candidatus Parcubacteria bacterium]
MSLKTSYLVITLLESGPEVQTIDEFNQQLVGLPFHPAIRVDEDKNKWGISQEHDPQFGERGTHWTPREMGRSGQHTFGTGFLARNITLMVVNQHQKDSWHNALRWIYNTYNK